MKWLSLSKIERSHYYMGLSSNSRKNGSHINGPTMPPKPNMKFMKWNSEPLRSFHKTCSHTWMPAQGNLIMRGIPHGLNWSTNAAFLLPISIKPIEQPTKNVSA